jgi:hypothetical protein
MPAFLPDCRAAARCASGGCDHARPMGTVETVSALAAFDRRGAGSDAERRAALWLARELETSGREARIEPFWCRPNWALAHVWHIGLGLAGALLAVSSPYVGAALILASLVSVVTDGLFGLSPGRRLTPERASQNVVGPARSADRPSSEAERSRHVRLIITANYDAGRTGLVYQDRLRTPLAWLKRSLRGLTPGWLGWLVIALLWLELTAIARVLGSHGTLIGALQLPPTIALVLGLALLLDAASASFGPAAGDNGSGVAVALALARALDAAPPRRATVELVLQGAGDGSGIGLRSFLRAHRSSLKPPGVVVLGIAPCAAGAPCWWVSDGALLPIHSFPQLRSLCAEVAAQNPELGARSYPGWGASPSLAARLRRLPAISIGCADERGTAPRSHQLADTPDGVDSSALDGAVEFGLLLVDALDAFLARGPATPGAIADQARPA